MGAEFKTEDTPTLTATLDNHDLSQNLDRVQLYVDHPGDGVLVVNEVAEVVDAEASEVRYEFSQAETARKGTHRAEFVVHYTDGSQLSYPPKGFLELSSNSTLDRETSVDEVEADPNLALTTLYLDRIEPNSGDTVQVQSHTDYNGNDLLNVGAFDAEGVVSESDVGAANGVAGLDENSVLIASQVPDLAITDTHTVVDETERLNLDVEVGDVALQQDDSKAFVFAGGDPSDNSNWSEWLYPEPPIDSVFGRTGSISAESGDYTYSQIGGSHGNEDHSETYISDGDGVERQYWLIPNGASDPAGADPEDIIFEEES